MNHLSGEEIVILANAIAILLSQNRTTEEISYIASILFAIGASMNVIANHQDLIKGKEGQGII